MESAKVESTLRGLENEEGRTERRDELEEGCTQSEEQEEEEEEEEKREEEEEGEEEKKEETAVISKFILLQKKVSDASFDIDEMIKLVLDDYAYSWLHDACRVPLETMIIILSQEKPLAPPPDGWRDMVRAMGHYDSVLLGNSYLFHLFCILMDVYVPYRYGATCQKLLGIPARYDVERCVLNAVHVDPTDLSLSIVEHTPYTYCGLTGSSLEVKNAVLQNADDFINGRLSKYDVGSVLRTRSDQFQFPDPGKQVPVDLSGRTVQIKNPSDFTAVSVWAGIPYGSVCNIEHATMCQRLGLPSDAFLHSSYLKRWNCERSQKKLIDVFRLGFAYRQAGKHDMINLMWKFECACRMLKYTETSSVPMYALFHIFSSYEDMGDSSHKIEIHEQDVKRVEDFEDIYDGRWMELQSNDPGRLKTPFFGTFSGC